MTPDIDAERIRQYRDEAKRVIGRHRPDPNTGTCVECGRSALTTCDAPEVTEALGRIRYWNDALRGVDRMEIGP